MNHQFSSLNDVYSADAFITSDAYMNHSYGCNDCLYHRSDAIFRGKEWRGAFLPALINSSSGARESKLILGHSDRFIGIREVLLLRSLGYRKIFGINVINLSDISFPIPLGITNYTNESDYHRLFGDNELLIKANSTDFPTYSNGLVYGCFSINTNIKERLPLAKLLSQSKHTFAEPEFSMSGRIQYLENLRTFAFTVCPVGNGVDTHRLWEVLYMGGIPIIKKNRILESMLEDLPFVLVKDWEQIKDGNFLHDSWNNLASMGGFNFDKLKVNYWINSIHTR